MREIHENFTRVRWRIDATFQEIFSHEVNCRYSFLIKFLGINPDSSLKLRCSIRTSFSSHMFKFFRRKRNMEKTQRLILEQWRNRKAILFESWTYYKRIILSLIYITTGFELHLFVQLLLRMGDQRKRRKRKNFTKFYNLFGDLPTKCLGSQPGFLLYQKMIELTKKKMKKPCG